MNPRRRRRLRAQSKALEPGMLRPSLHGAQEIIQERADDQEVLSRKARPAVAVAGVGARR